MTLNDELTSVLRKFENERESISEGNKAFFVNLAKGDVFDKRVSFVPAEYGEFFTAYPPGFLFESVKNRIEEDLPSIMSIDQNIRPYLYCPQIKEVKNEKTDETSPYWNNGYFGGSDARCAYALAAALRPKRIVEIGIGNSTKFFRKSIDDFNLQTSLIAIDPSPRAEVRSIVDELILGGIHTTSPSFFASLEAGDFLFLDGTHQVINGSDVPKFFWKYCP